LAVPAAEWISPLNDLLYFTNLELLNPPPLGLVPSFSTVFFRPACEIIDPPSFPVGKTPVQTGVRLSSSSFSFPPPPHFLSNWLTVGERRFYSISRLSCSFSTTLSAFASGSPSPLEYLFVKVVSLPPLTLLPQFRFFSFGRRSTWFSPPSL